MEIGYIALSVLMNSILFLFGLYAINKTVENQSKKRNKILLLLSALIIWQIYLLIVGRSGMLQDYSFPPRVVLFLILPAFLVIAVFLYTNKNKPWIHAIPKQWLIFYQTFRIGIETLFVVSVAKGVLPAIVTIKGYNVDLIFAITAPMVAVYLYVRRAKAVKIALLWNYLGLMVIATIIALFVTTIYFPQLYGSKVALMPKAFGLYPYPIVPGFLMPSAVFIHVLSIMQLRKKDR